MTPSPQDGILREYLTEARRIVVFTGAGISTESGIADYRSRGGRWERFQPVTIQEFLASADKRREYWLQKKELMAELGRAQPNEGHKAIARLWKLGKVAGVITQNIDGLHQMTGLPDEAVTEIHGTNRTILCLDCGRLESWQPVYQRLVDGEDIPDCVSCGGILKPNTISFGQALDPNILDRAIHLASSCDLLLAVGSTLVVEPAASLPRLAKENGAKLIIITLSHTPLDVLADLVIRAAAGPVLSNAVQA